MQSGRAIILNTENRVKNRSDERLIFAETQKNIEERRSTAISNLTFHGVTLHTALLGFACSSIGVLKVGVCTMRSVRSMNFLVLIALLVALAIGCAQDVGDIDRTSPNRTLKSDLLGDWYFAQTVTEVPSTSVFTFIGETSSMER